MSMQHSMWQMSHQVLGWFLFLTLLISEIVFLLVFGDNNLKKKAVIHW